MNNIIYHRLFFILMIFLASTKVFSQDIVVNKKERQEQLARTLELTNAQSIAVSDEQDRYHEEINRILRDTARDGVQRSTQLKAAAEQHVAALKKLLSPLQKQKLADAIGVRNASDKRLNALKSKIKDNNAKHLKIDTNKVKNQN